jgi:SHS family lactate transporter-like MFS transporter
MTAFNFFSHGTQDLFPTFLSTQRGFPLRDRLAHRDRLQHRRASAAVSVLRHSVQPHRPAQSAIALAAAAGAAGRGVLGLLPVAPQNIAIAAFVMQFMVQGAWGVVPVHLNELSPQGLRATFPGFVYQLGNLIASPECTIAGQYRRAPRQRRAAGLRLRADSESASPSSRCACWCSRCSGRASQCALWRAMKAD